MLSNTAFKQNTLENKMQISKVNDKNHKKKIICDNKNFNYTHYNKDKNTKTNNHI